MKPLISVIVPIYNVEGYVEKCIRSILDQTWRELEVILADDGSTDASGAICDRFAGQDSRVRVIHLPNSGSPAGPRNAGIDAAAGQWLTFVDGDDYLDPDMVEYLYGLCEKTGSQISRCGVRHVGFPVEDDEPHGDGEYAVYDGRQAAEHVLLGARGFSASASHALFHESVARQYRFPAIRCFEDLEYAFLTAYASQWVCCSLAPKYNYVWREGNSHSSALLSKISDLDVVMDDLSRFVEEHDPALEPALRCRFVDNALYHVFDCAARDGMTPEEKTAVRALRRRVLDTEFDVGRLSLTSKLWYYSLRLGLGPFTALSRALYAYKYARSRRRARRRGEENGG